MDFLGTLTLISRFLDEHEVRYALVGGLALAAYGGTRATLDIDLAVAGEGQERIIGFMEAKGFETLYRSTGYSNHQHPEDRLGRVDFIYVRGSTADQLFSEAKVHELPGGVRMPVPKAEHLAAMKVLAMKNDPGRTFQELADIRLLLQAPGVDRAIVRAFFAKHGLENRFGELEETL